VDPVQLAGSAVALLLPFLPWLTEKLTEHAADRAVASALPAVRRLYGAVKEHLAPGTYGGSQLAGVEEHPDREGRRQALVSALAEAIAEDEAFATEVARLVADARTAVGAGTHIHVEGPMAMGGDVRMQGHNVAGRDLIIGSRPAEEPPPDPERRG
jgi:hypothetical protein